MQVKSCPLVGGTRVRDDIEMLREGYQVVVGTPGRVHDMIENRRALGELCSGLGLHIFNILY